MNQKRNLNGGTEWDNIIESELEREYNSLISPESRREDEDRVKVNQSKKENQMGESKNIFKSRTFWTNIAVVAGVAATEFAGGQLPVSDTTGLGILGIVNIILRGFTSKSVHITSQNEETYIPPSSSKY